MVSIRGLNTEGFVDIVKERVQHYMSLPNGPPTPIPILMCPTTDLLLTTQMLTAMIAHLMILEVNETTIKADRRIKLFLSFFDKFDQQLTLESNTHKHKSIENHPLTELASTISTTME